LISAVTYLLHLILTQSDNNIGNEGVIKLSVALKSNTALTSLNLRGDNMLLCFTDTFPGAKMIGAQGVNKLSEALKSIKSLISLDLGGKLD
jgi:hypothetical protein